MGGSWKPLGGFLGPPGSVWRLLGKLFGYRRAFLARPTPSGAVLGPPLGGLGALLGLFGAVLDAILGVLEASKAVLGPSWGRHGGLLGHFKRRLKASCASMYAYPLVAVLGSSHARPTFALVAYDCCYFTDT